MGTSAFMDAWAGMWATLAYGNRGLLFYLGIYTLLGVSAATLDLAQELHLSLTLVSTCYLALHATPGLWLCHLFCSHFDNVQSCRISECMLHSSRRMAAQASRVRMGDGSAACACFACVCGCLTPGQFTWVSQ